MGDTQIDGVVGHSAPVLMNFMDVTGSKTGAMFPTGNRQDLIEGMTVTLIDVAVPMVLFNAADLGIIGAETSEQLNDAHLIERMERVRLIASERMDLVMHEDASSQKWRSYPGPEKQGTVTSRYFVPQNCHPTHAVTGAIGVATAIAEPGTIVTELVQATHQVTQKVIIEHPLGTIDVHLSYDDKNLVKAGVIRTAKKIMQGMLFVPKKLMD